MPEKWDLSDPKQKRCYLLTNQLMDESDAVEQYKKLASEFRESDNPGIRSLGILADKLASDEESHRVALMKVIGLLCPK